MYERRSRLSKTKRDGLLEHFVAGTTARAAAELVGVHRNTAASGKASAAEAPPGKSPCSRC